MNVSGSRRYDASSANVWPARPGRVARITTCAGSPRWWRILTRGGIFLYPRDNKDPNKPSRLRLMYEANPISFIIEQAGGLSVTGRERVLELQPESLHQRAPFIFGSKSEVERLLRYHEEFDRDGATAGTDAPLFSAGTLFRGNSGQ